MTDSVQIPTDINKRITHFENEVARLFSFLNDFSYIPQQIEKGKTETFNEYFSKFCFKNGDTSITIEFTTDIINGHTIAFPQVKERPVIDNLISCFITDKNAFMSVSDFAEAKHLKISDDYFGIKLNTKNIQEEITRVLNNYSDLFRNNLIDVLNKEKIYNCYTDRFYDKVFKEIHYR